MAITTRKNNKNIEFVQTVIGLRGDSDVQSCPDGRHQPLPMMYGKTGEFKVTLYQCVICFRTSWEENF